MDWGHNLDAFNDILRGGLWYTQRGGFILKWKNSELSRANDWAIQRRCGNFELLAAAAILTNREYVG